MDDFDFGNGKQKANTGIGATRGATMDYVRGATAPPKYEFAAAPPKYEFAAAPPKYGVAAAPAMYNSGKDPMGDRKVDAMSKVATIGYDPTAAAVYGVGAGEDPTSEADGDATMGEADGDGAGEADGDGAGDGTGEADDGAASLSLDAYLDPCANTKCLSSKFGQDEEKVPCVEYDSGSCFLAGKYANFYRRIKWDELKAKADELFKGFGVYCTQHFNLDTGIMDIFREVYQDTEFLPDGVMFSEIAPISADNSQYCKDIVYSFSIPCGSRRGPNVYNASIFHIALHSKKSHFKGLTRLRSGIDRGNCGYVDRKSESKSCKAGFGAFHYKIDSVHSLPLGKARNSRNCQSLQLSQCRTPYKEFYYNLDNLEFVPPSPDVFRNPKGAFVNIPKHPSQTPKSNISNVLLVHTRIYNLFIEFFNMKMVEWNLVHPLGYRPPGDDDDDDDDDGASRGATRERDDRGATSLDTATFDNPYRLFDAIPSDSRGRGAGASRGRGESAGRGRGARRGAGGGRSIKRKSRRTRKSRKTKGSKKPRKSRKTRRLRKTRKLRK